ncbi:MAG: formate dehydrogenase accessory sulfurtransferase FdhD, partial [Planctomycetota bacterium]
LEIDGERLLTMRTPGQDLDLALGFLLAEGLVRQPDEVETLEMRKGIPLGEPGPGADGDGLLPDRVVIRLRHSLDTYRARVLRRTQEIRPSCGLCGVEDLHSLVPEGGELVPGAPRLDSGALNRLLERFHAEQRLFKETGGSHGAAIFDAGSTLLGFGEDIGRHNALDKAIGQVASSGGGLDRSIAVLSGRAGYELVAKLLRLSCPVIVSVSAASALSFELCREAGATLIGFARGGRVKVYWDEGRFGE